MSRHTRNISGLQPARILIRATNWIGDAIMTLPAIRTIRRNFPASRLVVLSRPWVAELHGADPQVDEVILYDKNGQHGGLRGLFRLARELRAHRFDLAILLQNAFEAAMIARLAGIPVIAGYSRDGRRPLLTHPVAIRPEIRRRHQVLYYQDLLRQLGLAPGPDDLYLPLSETAQQWARAALAGQPRPIIGINPGAAYGPAKRWPAERYAAVARELWKRFGGTPVVFGTKADQQAAAVIGEAVPATLDLTGRTTLAQAAAAIARCDCFLTNDSGLMHVAAAAGIPLVAVFGSTDPVATGPASPRAKIVRHALACAPCLQPTCKTGFACMLDIEPAEVAAAATELLAAA